MPRGYQWNGVKVHLPEQFNSRLLGQVNLHVESLTVGSHTYDSHGPGAEPMSFIPDSTSLGPVRINQNLVASPVFRAPSPWKNLSSQCGP